MTGLVLVGCTLGQPAPPTPEPFTALYLVNNGPYPLYAQDGEWLATRVSGLPLAQADHLTITARRVALVQDPNSPTDGPWLHSGCLFDVERTRPDQQDASYVWAYGRVFRCDDLIETGIPEPEMGMRPHALRIYDGSLGYFPMSLLEPYSGNPPAPRT